MSSPNVAKGDQYNHRSSGVGFGHILDIFKVKGRTSVNDITNRNGGPQEFEDDSFPNGYLAGTEEKQVGSIFDCTTDRAEG